MTTIKRLVLDVLKPHDPSSLEFCRHLAEQGRLNVRLKVMEMDEKTETVTVEIEGEGIDFVRIQAAISEMGASLHSIDEVDVWGDGEADES